MDKVARFREMASIASGGTSGTDIKDAIIVQLQAHGLLHGSVLDFGAGQGELLKRLRTDFPHFRLAGCDLMPRPSDIGKEIEWFRADLNAFSLNKRFDLIICSEVIEYLENPRQVFRTIYDLLVEGGTLILTMPNQESIRSYAGLLVRGHFVQFLSASNPGHITALLRLDLERICAVTGFTIENFFYNNRGSLPKLPQLTWQQISGGLLKGRFFSDNIGLVATKGKSVAARGAGASSYEFNSKRGATGVSFNSFYQSSSSPSGSKMERSLSLRQ